MGSAGCATMLSWGGPWIVAAASRCSSRHCCLLCMLRNMLMPQISHMLLRVFERCEPARPDSATLTAILQHPAWVSLALSAGRPSCAQCIVVIAWRRRRRCGAIATAQTTIFQHPAGVSLTLSAGCPTWAELVAIGACRRRWRGTRRRRRASATRWGRTRRVVDACARGTIRTGLVAPSRAILSTIPALDAWIGRWQVQRKRRIQPQHVDLNVIPERNRHDVAAVQRLAHGRCTPLFIVIVHVTEDRLRGLAPSIRDAVGIARSQERRGGIRDHVAVLDVIPHYLGERPLVRPIGGEELSHDSHGLRRVDHILGAAAEEHPVAQPVWVHVTTVFVADTIITLARGIVATIGALTP